MTRVALVFLGGGLGAACRYGLSGLVYRIAGENFPHGTLVVNLLGCLLIGLLMAVFEDRFLVAPALRIFLTIGVLGGFTTFSTFSYETVQLLSAGRLLAGGLNVVLSAAGCVVAAWCGMLLGKLI